MDDIITGLSWKADDACDLCKELTWSNGDEATEYYGFWSDLHPDDAKGDCVYVSKNGENYVYDRPYTWSFGNCLTKLSFVCERMAAPEGKLIMLIFYKWTLNQTD